MKRSEWYAARESAGRMSSEGLAKFSADIASEHAAGMRRGGPSCCGTTGVWHNPWCPIGPWEPEGRKLGNDSSG